MIQIIQQVTVSIKLIPDKLSPIVLLKIVLNIKYVLTGIASMQSLVGN
jgi:hypothetical protein